MQIPDFDGELKIHLLPQGKNDILIRLTNLYDLFDMNDRTEEHSFTFDLKSYAMNLYKASNHMATTSSNDDMINSVSVKITERSLSNNQNYDDMVAAKFAWPTAPEEVSKVIYPEDPEEGAVIALQPQRIRLFRVEYDVVADDSLLVEQ